MKMVLLAMLVTVAIVGLCLGVSDARADGAWVGGTSTDWTETTNWNPNQDPNSAGFIATFGDALSNPTANLGANSRTIGQAIFNGNVNTTITATGVLTVDNSSATSNFTVSGGSHAINAQMTLSNAVSVGLGNDASRSLTLGGAITGAQSISRSFGLGTLTFGGNNSAYSGTINFDSYGASASYPMGTIAIQGTNPNPLGTGRLNIGGDGNNLAYAAYLDVGSGAAITVPNRLEYHTTVIQGSRDVVFSGPWGSAQGDSLYVTNTGRTEFSGNWNPLGDAGSAFRINGTNVNIVLSGFNHIPYAGAALGGTGALTGTVTVSGTIEKEWYVALGNNNNPSNSVFTLKIASDTAFTPSAVTANLLQAHQLRASRGVTFEAVGGPRTIHQTLMGRGVNFAGSNALTFDCADGGYDGVSALLQAPPPGDSTNWFSFNGGKVTFQTGVKTDGVQPFEVRGTTGTMIVNGTANFQKTLAIAGGTLLINGTMTAGDGSAVQVNGGTLGGTGIISRSVTVNPLGTLAPGASIGMLTLNSASPIVITGKLLIDVDGTAFGDCDVLNVTGGAPLDITGGTVDFNVLSPLDDPAYQFVYYTSLAGSGTFSSVLNLPDGYSINYNYMGRIALVREESAIPEPAGLGLIGAALLFLKRRRS